MSRLPSWPRQNNVLLFNIYLFVLILIIARTLECCIDVKIGFQKLNKILFSKRTFRLFVIYPFLDYLLFIFTRAMIDIIPVKRPFSFLCCPVHHGSSHPSVIQSSLRSSSTMSFFVRHNTELCLSVLVVAGFLNDFNQTKFNIV